MSIHNILVIPDPRLRQIAKPVITFDKELETLVEDMFETMYAMDGCGLAAPQIGLSMRMTVVDCSQNSSEPEPLVLINPEIIEATKETCEFNEGCLSVPGVFNKVIRPAGVKVRAQNVKGEFFEMEAEGLLSDCFQHELDHLNGKVFIDYLSPIKRQMARQKVEKFIRERNRRM